MPYTVYKVINAVTGDFYIGVHKTSNPNDDYLGSGKNIRTQLKHYGREKFSKEILFTFDKKVDAFEMEREIVDPLLGTVGCLNLHPGGQGGYGFINRKGLNHPENLTHRFQTSSDNRSAECVDRCAATWKHRYQNDSTFRSNIMKASKTASEKWKGQHHSEETKRKMRENHPCGPNGTCWIKKGECSQRISVEDLKYYEMQGWEKGRITMRV